MTNELTVQGLIDLLAEYPTDMNVVVLHDESLSYSPLTKDIIGVQRIVKNGNPHRGCLGGPHRALETGNYEHDADGNIINTFDTQDIDVEEMLTIDN